MKKEKLTLKKETIVNLNNEEMSNLKGGFLSIYACKTNGKTRGRKCCCDCEEVKKQIEDAKKMYTKTNYAACQL